MNAVVSRRPADTWPLYLSTVFVLAAVPFLLLGSVAGCSPPVANQQPEQPVATNSAEPPADAKADPKSETPQIEPKDANTFIKSGNSFYAKKDYDKAIADFTEAIRLDPKLAEAYGRRAHAYQAKGDDDKAIADAGTAIELDSKLFDAYYSRGYAFLHKSDNDKAIADFTKAIELKPNSPRAFFGRGNAYASNEQTDLAIKDYTEAIRLKPDYAAAYRKRSVAYDKQGKRAFARADREKAVQPDAEKVASDDDETAKRPSGAVATNTRTAPNAPLAQGSATPATPSAARLSEADYLSRAVKSATDGKDEEAIGWLTKAIQSRSPSRQVGFAAPTQDETSRSTLFRMRGAAHLRLGHTGLALSDLNEAIRLDPHSRSAYGSRADFYAKQGNELLADADRAEASRLRSPDSVPLAALLHRLDDKDSEIRETAVEEITKIGKPAVPALIGALTGEGVKMSSPRARAAVSGILGAMGPDARRAVPILVSLAAANDESDAGRVRVAAITACPAPWPPAARRAGSGRGRSPRPS